jgi:hypothetical protein
VKRKAQQPDLLALKAGRRFGATNRSKTDSTKAAAAAVLIAGVNQPAIPDGAGMICQLI